MKKTEVQVGFTYIVKVSGALAPVRLTEVNPLGGWNGVNLRTNRQIRIYSAAKLRKELFKTSEEVAQYLERIAKLNTKRAQDAAEYAAQDA